MRAAPPPSPLSYTRSKICPRLSPIFLLLIIALKSTTHSKTNDIGCPPSSSSSPLSSPLDAEKKKKSVALHPLPHLSSPPHEVKKYYRLAPLLLLISIYQILVVDTVKKSPRLPSPHPPPPAPPPPHLLTKQNYLPAALLRKALYLLRPPALRLRLSPSPEEEEGAEVDAPAPALCWNNTSGQQIRRARVEELGGGGGGY